MKMPVRFNIVKQLVLNAEGLTPEEILQRIQDDYNGERSCTVKEIDKQLMSMKGAGLTNIIAAEEADGKLMVTYQITDYGINLAKEYIPEFL